jgi:hypothetical protein
MEVLISTNPGLRSRFPTTIHFPDYSTDELLAIFELRSAKSAYHLDDDARAKVRAWLEVVPRGQGFGNGRVARNLFETAVARHATRIVSLPDPSDEVLTTLTADDIPDAAPGGGEPEAELTIASGGNGMEAPT